MADAEDVVQEAQLRLHTQTPQPDNADAWLFRTVTHLALDRLRHEKVKRKHYVGPWLPEPIVDPEPDGAAVVEMAEELSLGFLFMLERLSPAERVVFVLREGFDLDFDEIGDLLDVTPSACRQRLRRARANLAREPFDVAPASEQRRLLAAMVSAVQARDLDRLVNLFSDDAVVYTDGGGVVSAAIVPITEPQRIAQVTLHLTQRLETDVHSFESVLVNGAPGLAIFNAGELETVVCVDVADGQITRVYAMRNPNKLYNLRLK